MSLATVCLIFICVVLRLNDSSIILADWDFYT